MLSDVIRVLSNIGLSGALDAAIGVATLAAIVTALQFITYAIGV